MAPETQVTGLLLCRVAGHRLAFPAAQVVSVDTWRAGIAQPHARLAVGSAGEKGRVLISSAGEAVGVDAIEVCQDTVSLLPPPRLLTPILGGSLVGFVQARTLLWPLLGLAAFSRYLSAQEVRAA